MRSWALTLVVCFLLAGCRADGSGPSSSSLRNPPEPQGPLVPRSPSRPVNDVSTAPGRSVPEELVNSVGMRFVRVEPGECVVEGDEGKRRELSFYTQHSAGSASRHHPGPLRVERSFWIGRCEVLRSEFERVLGRRPAADLEHWSVRDTPDKPAVHVSLEEAREFCRRLSEAPDERAASRTYRLPTPAEWGKRAREGTAAGSYYRCCFGWRGHFTVHEWTSETDEHGEPVTAVAWSHSDPHSAGVATFRVVVEEPAGGR